MGFDPFLKETTIRHSGRNVSKQSNWSVADSETHGEPKMDDELLELQRQFEFAQQAKSSIRLSDRNVVELVQKLQELHIIDFELLHTVSGKEYITPVNLSLSLSLFVSQWT